MGISAPSRVDNSRRREYSSIREFREVDVIKGVDSVVLGLDDLSSGRRFYEDFGLSELEHGADHATFETLDGTSILLRGLTDAALPAAVCDGPTIREVVWGVGSRQALQAIAAELSKDRQVREDAEGVLHTSDDDGYGIAFRVEQRRAFSPEPNRTNMFGATPNRAVNTTIDFNEAARPASVAHVVVFSPDVAKAERFYVDRLGFRVSDRFEGAHGVFLRAPGSEYHHSLFIMRREQRGLHHVAFHVRDFTDVMNAGVSLLKKGWQPAFGPGRHILGANYFWYFQSPFGGAMELTADMDRVDDAWTPREVEFRPENTAAWSMTFNAPRP
jgi:catechol 2,3-dioxygenase-like lactoylglutathione lyase family enzyme